MNYELLNDYNQLLILVFNFSFIILLFYNNYYSS